ncbi:MAG TPA: hypothetical protein VK899_10330, partial [Gemmatimonadales bacterium]|nr:hypothetical protein [Gemmatimonadales bacterium]
ELVTDLIKQVARRELERRAAKKATKAVKKAVKKAAPEAPPTVPRERERVDARLLAEGLGLPENDAVLADVQRALDGEATGSLGKNSTPRQIADMVDGHARARSDSTAIQHGSWFGRSQPDNPNYDPEWAADQKRQYDEGMARVQALRDLATRIRGVRRRSVKKAAPASPEVAKLQDKVDNLEAANIDQVLEQLQGAKDRESGAKALERLTMDELKRLADQAGTKKGRTKQSIRDGLLDRFVGTETPAAVTLEQFHDLPSREAAHEIVDQLDKGELLRLARELSVPGAGSLNMKQLRKEIVEATTGRRLDSIAIRGFKGHRPGVGDVAGAPDLPTVPPPAPGSTSRSLGIRVREAGIEHPGETFSDVDSAIGEADRRLKAGEDPTAVARFLRERAARVAKADINEEGRRFKTEKDRDSLLSIRKQSAEYLRRVATHVQQEKKAQAPAKKAVPGAPSASRTGTSTVTGERSRTPEGRNHWGTPSGEINYHPDGVIGNGIKDMGDDR